MKSLILRAQFAGRIVASEAWNLLFPKGTWHGENLRPIGGSITIDDAMLEEMVANWRGASAPPLPVYKTHAHLDEDVSALERAELSKAYGYLTDFRVTAAGLEAKTEWTPAGKRMVDEGEFAFWSPEWQPRHRDRRTGEAKGWWLSGTALCSNPFFDSMPQLAAQEMPPVAASADDAEEKSTEPTLTKEQHMTKEQLEALRASLGLAADATMEQIIKASADQRAALVASEAKLKDSTPTAEVITAAVAPVKAQIETLQAELAKRDAAILERDVEALVATAKRGDGKSGRAINDTLVATAKKLARGEGGLVEAKAFLEAIPMSVPLKATGVSGGDGEPLTAETAGKKLLARAEELRAQKDPNPMITAMREMPEVALIAEGRTTSR